MVFTKSTGWGRCSPTFSSLPNQQQCTKKHSLRNQDDERKREKRGIRHFPRLTDLIYYSRRGDFTTRRFCSGGRLLVVRGEGSRLFLRLPSHPPATSHDAESLLLKRRCCPSVPQREQTLSLLILWEIFNQIHSNTHTKRELAGRKRRKRIVIRFSHRIIFFSTL